MDHTRPDDEQPSFPHTQFAFIATIGITFLYYLSSSLIALGLGITTAEDDRMILLQAVGQLGFILAPTLIALSFSMLRPRRLLRLDRPLLTKRTWLVVLLSFILMQVCATSWDVIQRAMLPADWNLWLNRFSEGAEKILSSMMHGNDPLSILQAVAVVAIIPAVAEEVLYRGLMQRSLEESLGIRAAIINTAILFAVVHVNPQQIVPLIILSLVLGVLAQRSASLIPGIVLHFINNAFAVLVFINVDLRTLDREGSMSLPFAIPFFIGSIVALYFVFKLLPSSSSTEPIEARRH